MSIFMLYPKLRLLSNDIKKAQAQQLLRNEFQDRDMRNLTANLTISVNEIRANALRNITDLSSKVVRNSLAWLLKRFSANLVIRLNLFAHDS